MIVRSVTGSEVGRVEWVDVLKGLGILTVVWGHSGSPNAFYMFWFHMPLFFFASGYLYRFKPQLTGSAYLQRKVKHLLVPYSFYLLFLTLMMVGLSIWRGQPTGQFLSDNWKALLLGGSLLEGIYATFWFTTCLFTVQILYDYLYRKISSLFYKGLFVMACFLLAYWESHYFQGVFIPWNVDVALYAIVFYALGHFIKESRLLETKDGRNIVFGLALVISLGFIFLFSQRILDYGLDMKHRQYYYFGSNLILPLVFTLLFIKLSMIFTKISILKDSLIHLGRASMVIMYLHLLAVSFARQFIAITPIRFLIVGILFPLLFFKVVQVFPYVRSITLGENYAGVRAQFSENNLKL